MRDLNKIQSEAYRQVEEIRGVADAKATEIYARAYNQSPEAVAFYEFTRTMQSYKSIIAENTTIVLSTNSDLFKFLKGMVPDNDVVQPHVQATTDENAYMSDILPSRHSVPTLMESRLSKRVSQKSGPEESTETEFESTTAGHVRAAFVHDMRQIIRVVNALSDCRGRISARRRQSLEEDHADAR